VRLAARFFFGHAVPDLRHPYEHRTVGRAIVSSLRGADTLRLVPDSMIAEAACLGSVRLQLDHSESSHWSCELRAGPATVALYSEPTDRRYAPLLLFSKSATAVSKCSLVYGLAMNLCGSTNSASKPSVKPRPVV
jgi:hypothetical protein